MGHIPSQYLSNLEKYAYKSVDKSLITKHFLNPYWNWLITLCPRTVAPNTITLTGLLIVIVNFLTLLFYDAEYLTLQRGAPSPPPNWLYFTWAIGLFAYQSLDAIDGKQARRTGMAGPLGEMFDHGCDALNTTLEVIMSLYALNLGRSWWTVAALIGTHANFYLTTWEEYHTGQLYLGVFSGPVEGILMIIAIYIFTGISGPSFWDRPLSSFFPFLSSIPFLSHIHLPSLPYFPSYSSPIPLSDLPLNVSFMVFSMFAVGFNIFTSYSNVRKATRSTQGSSLSHPLLYLLPFFGPLLLSLWLVQPSPEGSTLLYSPLFLPLICSWGLQFAHLVGKIILSHVTKMPFPVWDPVWLVTLAAVLELWLTRVFGVQPIIQFSSARTTVFVYATLVVSLFEYARFCHKVIRDVTEHLGIACFTVRKKDAKGVWRKASEVGTVANGNTANGMNGVHEKRS
ncbi:Choline/ethanolaminephosphotransferase [Amanita muscaria]